MTSRKIDKNLDDLIFNLKLTKPTLSKGFENMLVLETKRLDSQVHQHAISPIIISQLPSISSQNYLKPLHTETIKSQYDSVVNDNYDDFNSYSFYELKQNEKQTQQPQSQQFSFCHQFEQQNSFNNNDDSLNRFSSIVDKLKTQGDHSDSRDDHFFYSYEENNSTQLRTDRTQFNDQFYSSQVQQHKDTERRHTEYFSGSMLKSTQKSYKTLAKKIFEPSSSKPKAQPIYAKLTLNNDKQNNHQNSNICSKASLMSALSSKKSNYSSVIKKTFNPTSKNIVKPLECSTNKVKVKQLNQKIRKENQIVYQSELKQKNPDVSPLRSFKKSTIQPHKFSSYKVKLFG